MVRADGRPMEWETAIVRALACFLSLAHSSADLQRFAAALESALTSLA